MNYSNHTNFYATQYDENFQLFSNTSKMIVCLSFGVTKSSIGVTENCIEALFNSASYMTPSGQYVFMYNLRSKNKSTGLISKE